MSKKLYIGNLSFSTTEERLREIFLPYGEILSVTILRDKESGASKGFGFVCLNDENAAQKAIRVLSGREIDGRKIRVSETEEKRGMR